MFPMKNKAVIIILFAGIIASMSCNPARRLERMKAKVCPYCYDSTATITIVKRDTVEIHDTVLQFLSSGETPVFDNSQCDFSKTIKTDAYTAEITVTDGKISLRMLKVKAKVVEVVKETTKIVEVKKYYPVIKVKEVRYIPHLYLVSSWILWVVGALAIGYYAIKYVPQGVYYQIGLLAIKFIELFKKNPNTK